MNKLLKQAFTLIELLVVIAIIGILSGLIVVAMGGMTTKATIAKAQVFSNSMKNALMLNLISEWRLDGNMDDSWNGGNTGTWYGSGGGNNTAANYRPVTECVSGQCLDFDGTDDDILVLSSLAGTSNLVINGAITLAGWVKFNQKDTYQSIFGRGAALAAPGNFGYFISRGNDNKLYFDVYTTTTKDALSSMSSLSDSNWHYIVATWDGTTNTNGKKIYVDGAIDNQKTSTISTIGSPSLYFKIGCDGYNSYYFKGLIDEVRIYNAAIPTSQIKEQYYAGLNSLLANGSVINEEYEERINSIAIQ